MTVKSYLRYFLWGILFAVCFRLVLAIANYIIPSMFPAGITDILLSIFTLITLLTLFIFFSGKHDDPEKKVMKTGVALSLKTLLTLIFALILFIGFKKKNIDTVILFFIIYLGFTLFIVLTLFNTLKKSH